VAGVAIVIPVRADTAELATLLGKIATWRTRPAEILVSASEDSAPLRKLCAAASAHVIVSRANRGEQLDRGARVATAPILWFLHADADPPADGLALIEGTVAAGAVGGCFRFEFQGPRTPTKRLLEWLVALRIRLGGIAYGDQGLFARRDAYLVAGGFPHQPLFEEVRLERVLRAQGRFRVLAAPMRVATRRWERDGWWRRSWHNRWLALRFACGTGAGRLARSYDR
jgi:rSAM/selenodomain-associated transferase 2